MALEVARSTEPGDEATGLSAELQAPALSVVIPTHNRSTVVPRAVASVLAQTVNDFEIIVVDDGSSDDTSSVLAAMTDERIRVVRQENQGLSAARNAGASVARAKLLTFLDDDDQALPGWLDLFRAAFDDPVAGIVCCGQIAVDTEGRELRIDLPAPMGPAFDDQVGSVMAGTLAVRRALFAAVGGFEPTLKTNHATELAFRLIPYCLATGLQVHSVPVPGVKIEERPAVHRASRAPSVHYEGVTYLLEHHHDRIARSPRMLANYLSIAGVSAARAGMRRQARRLLAGAVRAEPWSPRRWARLLVAQVPFLSDLVWRLRPIEPLIEPSTRRQTRDEP